MEPILKTIQKIQIKPTPFNIIVTPKISSIEKPMRGVYGKHDTSGSKIAIGSQKGVAWRFLFAATCNQLCIVKSFIIGPERVQGYL